MLAYKERVKRHLTGLMSDKGECKAPLGNKRG